MVEELDEVIPIIGAIGIAFSRMTDGVTLDSAVERRLFHRTLSSQTRRQTKTVVSRSRHIHTAQCLFRSRGFQLP